MTEKLRKARATLRKAPLLFLVPASALLISIIAYIDPMGLYAGYTPKSNLEPLFVRVMVGGIQTGAKSSGSGKPAGAQKIQNAPQMPSVNGQEEQESGAVEAAGSKAKPPKFAKAKETDEGQDKESVEKREEDALEQENALSGEDALEQETALPGENAASGEDAPSGEDAVAGELDYTIPPESCCEVCPAKDYGLANPIYMAPKDWEPVADTTGFFATNGYYRPLHEVEKDYFSDALFIGDSRVDGLCDYGGLSEYATFLCKDSLTVYKLFSEAMRYRDPYGGRGYKSLGEVLDGSHFHKIYLQIGVNELGTGSTADFYEAYRNAVATIKTKQPTAIIYIEGIMHVTAAKSSSDSVFTNSLVVDKNRAISTLANGRDIFYLDPNPAVCDENGNLRSDLSMDHAHLKAKAHIYWTEFLMQKAADQNEPAAPVYITN